MSGAILDTTGAAPVPDAPRAVREMSGATFEQVMCQLGYPAWYRDDRVTRAIDAAWAECCETGLTSLFDIAAAAKSQNLPPVPTDRWV